MKKKILAFALIAICLSMVAYGTLAYFTYEETATNVITAGDVTIELQEWAIINGEAVPFEDVFDVMPGVEVSKIVQVKNTGGQTAWIRVAVEKAIYLADGVSGDVDLSLVTYDLNTDYWTERDGFYYYNAALRPDQITEPLFTKVTFSAVMSNMYQNSEATINVTAQATQVANNGTSAVDAVGWPESETKGDDAQ